MKIKNIQRDRTVMKKMEYINYQFTREHEKNIDKEK